jgi:hypothetical protein
MRKDKDGNFVEIAKTRIAYNIGKTPVIPVFSAECEDGTITPHPPYYSIARCNWSLFNDCSALTRLQRAQMFAILCAPKIEGGFGAGPNKGFELPADNTQTGEKWPAPFYLAPPIGPYQEIAETIKGKREELYRLAGQEGISGVRESKSGIAKSYDFNAEEWVLKETAKMAETAASKIAMFVKLFTSEEFDFTATLTSVYKPNYADDRMTRDTTIIDKVSTLSTPYTPIIAAALKDLLEIFYQGNEDDKKEIIEWIDENTDKSKQGDAGTPPTPDQLSGGGVKELLNSIMSKFNKKSNTTGKENLEQDKNKYQAVEK